MHLWQRLLLSAYLIIWLACLAPVMAQPVELAHRYLDSRPDLYGPDLLVAIGAVDPPRAASTTEELEAGILRSAKMLNPSNDWNPSHPRWEKVIQQIRADAPRLAKALQEDPRWRLDLKLKGMWRDTFADTLSHELSESDLGAIVDFYESPLGKRFTEVGKRIYRLAAEQKAHVVISRVKGEPYDIQGWVGLDLQKCQVCRLFTDRETLGAATGFPFPVFNYHELAEVWDQLLSEEERQAIEAFCSSEIGERERKAMRKASFAIRGTGSFKSFMLARKEAYDEIMAPYLKSWRDLMLGTGEGSSAP